MEMVPGARGLWGTGVVPGAGVRQTGPGARPGAGKMAGTEPGRGGRGKGRGEGEAPRRGGPLRKAPRSSARGRRREVREGRGVSACGDEELEGPERRLGGQR